MPLTQLDSVCISFDKMDKIGAEGVKAELTEKQLPPRPSSTGRLHRRRRCHAGRRSRPLRRPRHCRRPAYVIATAKAWRNGRYRWPTAPSLVRGQGYYTGMVFEVTCPQFSGAVAGGGRYDNMVGKFLGTAGARRGLLHRLRARVRHSAGAGLPDPRRKAEDRPAVRQGRRLRRRAGQGRNLRDSYNVTVLPQAKKLGKQLGQLEAGFAGAAFMDKDEIKIFAQQ